MSQEHYRFADLEWQPRWNKEDAPHLATLQSGPELMMTAFFGVLRFRLDNDEDCEAIARQATMIATAVRNLKKSYDEVMKQ